MATVFDEFTAGSGDDEGNHQIYDFNPDPFDKTPEAFDTYSGYFGMDEPESRALWNQLWYNFIFSSKFSFRFSLLKISVDCFKFTIVQSYDLIFGDRLDIVFVRKA